MTHIISIKVVPSSGKSLILVDKSGVIKCYVKGDAQRGAANKEVIKLIAKRVGISQDQVTIMSGATSRKKLIKIDADIDKEALLHLFGVSKQLPLFE